MKTRQGFVSNSSSSSFLIYGIRKNNFQNETLLKDSFLNIEYYYDEVYIGLSWDSIHDDETGAQFKERIQNEVTRIFGEEHKCSTWEEAWYDG